MKVRNCLPKYWILFLVIVLTSAFVSVSVVNAVESPPTGIPPDEFATGHQGCLGPLRSQIAQGAFEGVGPFGEHFTGDVNPGAHQGTVGEEEFLTNVLGVPDIETFCDG